MFEVNWNRVETNQKKIVLKANHGNVLVEIYEYFQGRKRYGFIVTRFENGQFRELKHAADFKSIDGAKCCAKKVLKQLVTQREHPDERFKLENWQEMGGQYTLEIGKVRFDLNSGLNQSFWDLSVKVGENSFGFDVPADAHTACYRAAQIYHTLHSFTYNELDRLRVLHKQIMFYAPVDWENKPSFKDGLITWFKANSWSFAVVDMADHWEVRNYSQGTFQKTEIFKTRLEAIDDVYRAISNPNPGRTATKVLWADECVGAAVMTGFSTKRSILFRIYIDAESKFWVTVVPDYISFKFEESFSTLQLAMEACEKLCVELPIL